jgi:hypothetical protein
MSLLAIASVTVGLHLHSVHAPQRDYHNDQNTGVYVRGENWQAGAYKNTYSRPTFYAGYVQDLGPLDLTVGGATGYQRKCGGATCDGFARAAVVPFAALSYTAPVQVRGVSPRVSVLPKLSKGSYTVVNLSLEWNR